MYLGRQGSSRMWVIKSGKRWMRKHPRNSSQPG